MAELKYSPNNNLLYIGVGDREKIFESNKICQRICILHDHSNNYSMTKNLLNLFNVKIDPTIREVFVVKTDINPWMMYLNNQLVIYFGEDTPIIKSKTVKSCTAEYKKWTNSNYKDPKQEETYYYPKVKNSDLLFIFGNTYKVKYYHKDCEIFPNQYLFKFDISDEEYNKRIAEKIKNDKEELEAKRKYWEELEERKRTPGYCSRCGSKNANYIVNPYNYEMYGDKTLLWLCSNCYDDLLGDI